MNLYGASELDAQWTNGERIALKQTTDYPWDGNILMEIEAAPDHAFSISLRIPGWVREDGAKLKINGKKTGDDIEPGTYHVIERVWRDGDRIELELATPVELIEANPLVEETRNQCAVKRGPMVYCLEAQDLPDGVDFNNIALTPDSAKKARCKRMTIKNCELTALEMPALDTGEAQWDQNALYRPMTRGKTKKIKVRLIPYFAWDNRGGGEMSVWLPIR